MILTGCWAEQLPDTWLLKAGDTRLHWWGAGGVKQVDLQGPRMLQILGRTQVRAEIRGPWACQQAACSRVMVKGSLTWSGLRSWGVPGEVMQTG